MRLHLIRHGQTPSNVLGILDTAHPGPGLTELGHAQAARIPQALGEASLDALYASRLVRTQLTAAPLAEARGLAVPVLDGVHEVEAGDLEGRGDRDSIVTFLKTTFAWGVGELDARMPGGPTGHDFFGRFDADVESVLATDAASAAIVSHGSAIRVWVARHARNVGSNFATEHVLENTGVVVMEGSFAKGWTLVQWAELPMGGAALEDASAPDPTGATLDDVAAE
ncbi:histidine phosphatase family protein [Salinibacterium sp. SYSU T00001]|uniref:histidine phosphatase family protein n=1 Tax=Homoserinimonas sedimenticola TaxID=2986805 RepID=UPI0022367C45|nr:histidine phosphatase family protein [Salinibacterium sedimenticola]MCW4386217.1 histidine phosphatase family protein [Salinibacterium sedimenticola]